MSPSKVYKLWTCSLACKGMSLLVSSCRWCAKLCFKLYKLKWNTSNQNRRITHKTWQKQLIKLHTVLYWVVPGRSTEEIFAVRRGREEKCLRMSEGGEKNVDMFVWRFETVIKLCDRLYVALKHRNIYVTAIIIRPHNS
jgi:hypothetical protein